MANFYTHVSVSGGLGIVGVTILCGASLVTPQEALVLSALCIFGGLFPDIDSDSEASIKIISQLFSGICAFLIIYPFMSSFAILISLGLFVLSYLAIRFGFFSLITKITVHRGLLHSIPFALLVCFISSIIMQYIFYTGVAFAWLGSSFLFIGYLSHLFLDECISENLAGDPVELPYGGTFQVIGFGNWIAFLILYAVVGLSFFFTPSFKPFSNTILSFKAFEKIEHHLFSGSLPVSLAGYSSYNNSNNSNKSSGSVYILENTDDGDIIEI